MIRLLIHPQAEVDIADAIAWYEQQRVELDMRRALLRRFPYSVYFSLTDSQDALVWAVLHQHRRPETLKDRVPTKK